MSGHSSVGRVQASQAWCREFKSRCPLQCNFAFSLRMGRVGKLVVLWDELNFFLMVIGMNR